MPPTQSADLGSLDAPLDQLARNQHERGCTFRNVCFTPSGDWNYYAPPGEFEETTTLHAAVDVWSRGGFGRGLPPKDRVLRVIHADVPETAGWLATPTLVHISLFAPSNFGHFLGNGLFPAFQSVWRLLGGAAARDPSMQLLFAGPNQTDVHHAYRQRQRCLRESMTVGAKGNATHHFACLEGRTPDLISKFVRELVPGLSNEQPLWETSLAVLAAKQPAKLLCARRIIVGMGGQSFATVFEHTAGTSAGGAPPAMDHRRPSIPLWGDFVEHLARRILLGEHQGEPEHAVMLTKRGRRAPTSRAFLRLRTVLAEGSSLPLRVLDPSEMSVRDQLRAVSRAPIGMTPDGGTSLLCAFMPEGAAVIVLGSLERWAWANDRRVRAFYCTPQQRDRHLPCDVGSTNDCYEADAVVQCVRDRMLPRALLHASAAFPAVMQNRSKALRWRGQVGRSNRVFKY